jgi:hypothetical protein
LSRAGILARCGDGQNLLANLAEQLERAGMPGPKAIGIDEISIRKGHTCRIVVSDLVRKRPIWFGGADRSEASSGGHRRVRDLAGADRRVGDLRGAHRSGRQVGHADAAVGEFRDDVHVLLHRRGAQRLRARRVGERRELEVTLPATGTALFSSTPW